MTNAPVVFMYLMNGIFINYLDKFFIVFLDDILIYSKSKEEHEHHYIMVMGSVVALMHTCRRELSPAHLVCPRRHNV